MKLLLISQDDYIHQIMDISYGSRNVALLYYRNPIKAIDNLEELSPDIIIFSAEDFPRHWKPFIRLYREYRDRNEGIFILLTGDLFPEEEIAKATHLEVNGLVNISYDNTEFIDNLDELLSRYIDIEDIRTEKRYKPKEYDELEFIFNHPLSETMITGKILDISGLVISFRPDNTSLTNDLKKNMDISNASLQIGENIYDVDVQIQRNQGVLVLLLIPKNASIETVLSDYIAKKSERGLAFLKKHQHLR